MITALRSFVRRGSNATLAILTLAILGSAFACPTLSTAQTEIDPWSQLRALKDGLTGEVVSADFVQTFLPSGFSSGDEETGVLSISIPDCLRRYVGSGRRIALHCPNTVHPVDIATV